MLFYRLGNAAEDIAVSRSRRSITALMDIRGFCPNAPADGNITCKPEEVALDDVIVVNLGSAFRWTV